MHTNPRVVAEMARLTTHARLRAAQCGWPPVADRPEIRRRLFAPRQW